MPKLSKSEIEKIKSIPQSELAKIVLKTARMEQSVYDYIYINYLEPEAGVQKLFEKTKLEISLLYLKSYKGYSEQLKLKNMLTECNKIINQFKRTTKNKVLEADLILFVLQYIFSYPEHFFGTAFVGFDYKVAQLLNKLIKIVKGQLHEDYLLEYQTDINRFLKILHKRSSHIDLVYDMPKEI